MNWQVLLGPMLAAMIGGVLSVLVLNFMRGQPGHRAGKMVVLSYGPVARFVALASLSLPILCLIAAWRSESLLVTSLFCVLFLVLAYYTILSSYLSCFVKLAFDEEGVYYVSPIRGGCFITWPAVKRIGYSDVVQTHYIKASNGQMFWLSRCMNGFDEFAAFARKKARNSSASTSA